MIRTNAWFAWRRGHFALEPRLQSAGGRLVLAGCALALVLALANHPVARLFAGRDSLHDVWTLAVLALIGMVVYGGVALALAAAARGESARYFRMAAAGITLLQQRPGNAESLESIILARV